jgi:hypothetical protein
MFEDRGSAAGCWNGSGTWVCGLSFTTTSVNLSNQRLALLDLQDGGDAV